MKITVSTFNKATKLQRQLHFPLWSFVESTATLAEQFTQENSGTIARRVTVLLDLLISMKNSYTPPTCLPLTPHD